MKKKIKIGVFGAHRGMVMIRVLLNHPDAELVAICDKHVPTLEKARAEAEKYGAQIALYTDFEDFFRHDMDAVVLANYANEHAPFAVRLLNSGRHVLSEVLPCETMAQAVELVEAVEKSGKVYAYAENYCYMWHSFEMRRCYEEGAVGEVMYAEGEYVHDCSAEWPGITYGEKEHWRNYLYPTYYCTHSLGPVLTITGRRPVQVSAFVTQQNNTVRPLGIREGECGAVLMVTLDNGAIVRSLHGHLKRDKHSYNYLLYGTKGMMEAQRFQPTYGADEKPELHIFSEGEKLCIGETKNYVPKPNEVHRAMTEKFPSHGGSDFFPTHFFIEKILGRPDGMKYSIDVYTALDMGICGILGYRSALTGNIPVKIPNLRNPEEREVYRHDYKCTNPRIATGEDLLPCYPTGSNEYPDEVYEEVRQMWLAGKKAE